MKLKLFVYKNRNKISFISLALIVIAFLSMWIFKSQNIILLSFNIFKKVYDITLFDIPLIIASIIGFIPISLSAFEALKVKVISIELLVTMAVLGAFVIKNFEESAIVTFLFLFGSFLEQITIKKTRAAIKELTLMAPEVANKKDIDGNFVEVDIDEVDVDDILLVKTGEKVPVDGKIINGFGYLNQASITGESVPVKKGETDEVFAGTILEDGTITIVAVKVGEDTTFGKIIELVEEAQDSKSEAERFIDKFSKYYTPVVLLIGLIFGLIFQDVELAVTILVLGCPGALVIGIPVSNVSGIGNGARNGVLFKGSQTVNAFSKTTTIIFDKTGTLTIGEPLVNEIINYDDNNYFDYLIALEKESTHPLAKAIIKYKEADIVYEVTNSTTIRGGGLTGIVNKKKVVAGNLNLLKEEDIDVSDDVLNNIKELTTKGNSIILFAVDGKLSLLIGIKDKLRDNVKEELANLRKLGVKKLVLLSGDNKDVVKEVQKELNLDEAIGEMLPEHKSEYVKNLQNQGEVVTFVGDGINDSPSLAIADIGISMGSGTDVAIEVSDVVLINSSFKSLTHALGLSKKTVNNMKENIIIAIGVVIILILSVIFADWMNMSIGMLAHEGSILVVILNGMRLLRYKRRR